MKRIFFTVLCIIFASEPLSAGMWTSIKTFLMQPMGRTKAFVAYRPKTSLCLTVLGLGAAYYWGKKYWSKKGNSFNSNVLHNNNDSSSSDSDNDSDNDDDIKITYIGSGVLNNNTLSTGSDDQSYEDDGAQKVASWAELNKQALSKNEEAERFFEYCVIPELDKNYSHLFDLDKSKNFIALKKILRNVKKHFEQDEFDYGRIVDENGTEIEKEKSDVKFNRRVNSYCRIIEKKVCKLITGNAVDLAEQWCTINKESLVDDERVNIFFAEHVVPKLQKEYNKIFKLHDLSDDYAIIKNVVQRVKNLCQEQYDTTFSLEKSGYRNYTKEQEAGLRLELQAINAEKYCDMIYSIAEKDLDRHYTGTCTIESCNGEEWSTDVAKLWDQCNFSCNNKQIDTFFVQDVIPLIKKHFKFLPRHYVAQSANIAAIIKDMKEGYKKRTVLPDAETCASWCIKKLDLRKLDSSGFVRNVRLHTSKN